MFQVVKCSQRHGVGVSRCEVFIEAWGGCFKL